VPFFHNVSGPFFHVPGTSSEMFTLVVVECGDLAYLCHGPGKSHCPYVRVLRQMFRDEVASSEWMDGSLKADIVDG